MRASQLKYLSINLLIGSPNLNSKMEIKKNLAPRDMIDANKNITKLILNAPAEIVIIL